MGIALLAAEAVGGGHVEDDPGSPRRHVPGDGLGDQEHAAQVHRDDLIPFGRADREERLAGGCASVVDQHIHPAQVGRGRGHHGGDVRLPADIAGHAPGLAMLTEHAKRRVKFSPLQPSDEDGGPFLEEAQRGGQADPAGAAADQDPLTS